MKISKDKSRFIKIVGVVLFVLLIIALTALAIYLPKEAVNDKENDAVPSYPEKEINNDKDKTESEVLKEESETIEENKTEEKREDAKANNADQNNKKEAKPSSGSSSGSGSTSSPKPTYSCPDGYKMSNAKCIKTINAEYVCPLDKSDARMHESVNNMCISFSEGYEVNKEHNCPSGETMIYKPAFMGTPEEYKCYPLHKKVYSCPSDYVLSGAVCTKTIDATKK